MRFKIHNCWSVYVTEINWTGSAIVYSLQSTVERNLFCISTLRGESNRLQPNWAFYIISKWLAFNWISCAVATAQQSKTSIKLKERSKKGVFRNEQPLVRLIKPKGRRVTEVWINIQMFARNGTLEAYGVWLVSRWRGEVSGPTNVSVLAKRPTVIRNLVFGWFPKKCSYCWGFWIF